MTTIFSIHSCDMIKKLYTLFLLSLLFVPLFAEKTIYIKNQTDFNKISQIISDNLACGENDLCIVVCKGEYKFSDKAIVLCNLNNPNANISIMSKFAIVKSQTELCDIPSDPQGVYLDSQDEYLSLWTAIQESSDTVRIVDKKKSLCSIPNTFNLPSERTLQDKYIQVSCWFVSKICPIKRITSDSIYFDAGDYCKYRLEKGYHINMDYNYAKKNPRVRFFALCKPNNNIKKCKSSNFLTISNCRVKKISMSGFTIIGSNSTNSLINIYNSNATSFDIKNNIFQNIGGTVLYDVKSENVHFVNNKVKNFYGYGIKSDNGSKGFVASDNTFTNGTLMWTNQFVICTRGENFIITNNRISNFMYGGIGAGLWHGYTDISTCSGMIDHNELFYTEDFLSNPQKYTLMDSGAIYTWTQSDGIIISNNFIHDIDGAKDNRGIFCDDGTKNVTLQDNLILRIKNCYCIDLRNCPSIAKQITAHNTCNSCIGNVVDGNIRFFIKDASCIMADNIRIGSGNYKNTKAYNNWKRRVVGL